MKDVEMTYTNYRGEIAKRRIRPLRVEVSSSEWHPQEQLVLVAIDLDRNVERHFTISDIGENAPIVTASEG